jgi:hypothetical protein
MVDPDRKIRVDTRLRRAIESGTFPKEVLVCGPAGTGKTTGILSILHMLAAGYHDLRILIVRQTRASLTESVMVTFEQEILPAAGMTYLAEGASRRNRASYCYPTGSEIVLGGLDKPGRIASTAWDVIYPAESIELEEEGFEILGSRLDRPGRPGALGWLLGDTNPGPASHWLKKRCDEGRTVLWETVHEANPRMWTGRDWTEAGRNYLLRLDRLRGTRRKRYKDGIWASGEGIWFDVFDTTTHVTELAEYNPRLPVHLAVDSGVNTAAVWFQIRGTGEDTKVNVFLDFACVNVPAFDAAKAILKKGADFYGGRFHRGHQDPAGDANSPTGIIVTGEYHRAGLKLENWPSYPGSKSDGLALVESFVSIDPPMLTTHPRCTALIEGFSNYRREKRGGQYLDRPVERQHPFEDIVDAARGGLMAEFSDGRRPKPVFRRVPGRMAG